MESTPSPKAPRSSRASILPWVFLLTTVALIGCDQQPSPLPEGQHACLPGQGQPSCFYPENPGRNTTKLLIFVHGVFGGASTTWGDPKSDTFWPKMVTKDPRFANDYDVYLMNYRTPYVREAPNIHETAGNELGKLESKKVFERYQEIYFIAHSMGGLVTKSILTRLNRGQDVARLRKVAAVVYLATPAQGADIAKMGAWLSLNPQLGNMERAHLNTYIQSLEDQWVQLMEDRGQAKPELPRAYCAYETLKTGPAWVVPREMAYTRCDGTLQPMPFNHMGIAEPTQKDDDPYLWVMAKIEEAGASGATQLKNKSSQKDSLELVKLEQETRQHLLQGYFSMALKEANELVQRSPNDAVAYKLKGHAHFKLDEYHSALEAFQAAINLDPKLSAAIYGKGASLMELGDYNQGKVIFEQLNKESPGDIAIRFWLALANLLIGDYNTAKDGFLLIYETEGDYVKAKAAIGLGLSEMLEGKRPELNGTNYFKEAVCIYSPLRPLFLGKLQKLNEERYALYNKLLERVRNRDSYKRFLKDLEKGHFC